jgi:hypothetical protein
MNANILSNYIFLRKSCFSFELGLAGWIGIFRQQEAFCLAMDSGRLISSFCALPIPRVPALTGNLRRFLRGSHLNLLEISGLNSRSRQTIRFLTPLVPDLYLKGSACSKLYFVA